MADLSTVAGYVDGFRNTLDDRMDQFFRYTKSRMDSFESDVDSSRTTELNYIKASIDGIIKEISKRKVTQHVSTNPLKDFKEFGALSTIQEYIPIYRDITTNTDSLISNLIEILNLPTDSESILSLVSKQNYTPTILACADSFITKCLNLTSDIGLPSELYLSILNFELEKHLLELRYQYIKSDAETSSKRFRKPNSNSVYKRTILIEEFNRSRLPRYKDAIETINNRMAELLAKAIQAQLSKVNIEIDMSSTLVDDLVNATINRMEFEVELRKIEFTKYRTTSTEAITSLQQAIKVINAKEQAGRKIAQELFKVQLIKALSLFEAQKAKAQAKIELSLRESSINTETLLINIKAKLQEIDFIKTRLGVWAQQMAQQSDDKIKHLESANQYYKTALQSTGQSAIALSTEK